MAYSYQPRDPRGKLREIVTQYIESMRVAGQEPNRGVVFGEAPDVAGQTQASGWLLDDPRSSGDGESYLLLDDGDVWHAKASHGSSTALNEAVAVWLDQPNDDLVTLLAKSLGNVRLGRSGWLEDGDGVEAVADRRSDHQPHGGPDRRGQGWADPDD